MDNKLFARIGAGVFVAIALTMTALSLREEPAGPKDDTIFVSEPDSDPLPAMLRRCAQMGQSAAADRDCLAAWAEKRRRFLGGGDREPVPVDPASEAPPLPSADPSSEGGR